MENDLNYRLIGKRLRTIRQKRGLTQEQLSELADISPQHCSGIECGAAKVSLPALVRLCNALAATPDEVLMDSVKQSAPLYAEKIAEVFSDCSSDDVFNALASGEFEKGAAIENAYSIERNRLLLCKAVTGDSFKSIKIKNHCELYSHVLQNQ